MQQIRKRLTFANVMSSIAIFLVLGGASAIAASHLGKNSVGSKQLKKNAVTAKSIKKNAVTAAKIKSNAVTTAKIKKGAVTGDKVNLATLGTVPSATNAATAKTFSGYSRKGLTRVGPTPAANYTAGLETAPKTVLFSAGPLTIYGQCFIEGTEVIAVTSIQTAINGVVFDSNEDSAEGNPFLDTNTLAEERELNEVDAGPGESEYEGVHTTEISAMAPDGTTVRGDDQIGVKGGDLPGGDGVFGPGNVCLFGGELTALNG